MAVKRRKSWVKKRSPALLNIMAASSPIFQYNRPIIRATMMWATSRSSVNICRSVSNDQNIGTYDCDIDWYYQIYNFYRFPWNYNHYNGLSIQYPPEQSDHLPFRHKRQGKMVIKETRLSQPVFKIFSLFFFHFVKNWTKNASNFFRKN